ncbi:hypothetical protein MBLNU457_g2916t1 [Dothideomycetes sp. NU457]
MGDALPSSDEHPDQHAMDFRVYISADIDLEKVYDLLENERTEDGGIQGFEINLVVKGLSAQEICKHHQETVRPGGKIYTTLFLIFDDPDPEAKGVLLVELGEYHGFWDAVRCMPDLAVMEIASLSIGNTDWYTQREQWEYETVFDIINYHFALYDLLTDGNFKTALDAMNDGVQGLHANSDLELSDDEIDTGLPGVSRTYHKGIQPEDRDLAQISRHHPSYARANGLDPEMFAVVDDKYTEEGVLFVRLDPGNESFRCKGLVAGEIFAWIFMRFMTWDEAKAFASRQP